MNPYGIDSIYETAFMKIHKEYFLKDLSQGKSTFMYDNFLQVKYGKEINFHVDFHKGT